LKAIMLINRNRDLLLNFCEKIRDWYHHIMILSIKIWEFCPRMNYEKLCKFDCFEHCAKWCYSCLTVIGLTTLYNLTWLFIDDSIISNSLLMKL
jgi:hypothetical protein